MNASVQYPVGQVNAWRTHCIQKSAGEDKQSPWPWKRGPTPMRKPTAISYAFFTGLLLLVAGLHLGTPFVAALFCYLAIRKLNFSRHRWIALVLFVFLLAAVFSGGVFFVKRAVVALPDIV